MAWDARGFLGCGFGFGRLAAQVSTAMLLVGGADSEGSSRETRQKSFFCRIANSLHGGEAGSAL